MKHFTLLQLTSGRYFNLARGFFLIIMLAALSFTASAQMSKLSVQLLLNQNGGSNNTADGLVAVFGSNFSAAIGNEDSYKFTNLDENMAIYRNGINLSIEGRPTVCAADTLPLKMWQFRHAGYFIKIGASNFPANVSAVLKDAYLGVETPINMTSSTVVAMNLTSDTASYAPFRYSIVFSCANILAINLTDWKAYQKDRGIQVDWTAQTDVASEGFEVEKSTDGLRFVNAAKIEASGTGIATKYGWYDANPLTGNNFYRIKMTEKSGVAKYSPIMKVNTGKAAGGIVVYPNPIVGNTIGLQINNMEKGIYTIKLYNNAGQNVYNGSLNHTGGSANRNITIDKPVGKGVFTLQLIKGSVVSVQSIVLQ